MAQQPSEIRARIQAEHESLKENFEEIEDRVKNALDWKVWYKKNTAAALGGAAAGGLLVSLMLRKRRTAEAEFIDMDEMPESETESSYQPRSPFKNSNSRLHQVMDNTLSAIFGVATDMFQDFMSKAIPGFREHYAEAQSRRRFE